MVSGPPPQGSQYIFHEWGRHKGLGAHALCCKCYTPCYYFGLAYWLIGLLACWQVVGLLAYWLGLLAYWLIGLYILLFHNISILS